MPTKRVHFTNRYGNRLAANIELPDDKPLAYAIYTHCFTCSKNLKSIARISRSLSDAGIAVLRFDFTGIADSEGEFEQTNLSHHVDDILAAAEFCQHNYGKPALLIGHSLGGNAVMIAQQKLASIKAIVLLATPKSPDHLGTLLRHARDQAMQEGKAQVKIGGRQFTLLKQFFQDLETLDYKGIIENVQQPVLIIHSKRDQTVPIEHAEYVFQHLTHPKAFLSLAQADHLFSDERDSLFIGQFISSWVRLIIHD